MRQEEKKKRNQLKNSLEIVLKYASKGYRHYPNSNSLSEHMPIL